MKYEEFKVELVKALKTFYKGDVDVELGKILKNNGKRQDAVYIRMDGEDGSAVPAIYLRDFFKMYDAGEMGIIECATVIKEIRAESGCPPQIAQIRRRLLKWESVREKIYPALLSTEGNRELLGKLASRSLMDLSVIYIIRETAEGGGGYSIKITRALMESYGVDEEQLYRQAIYNLERDDYHFHEMGEYLQRMIGWKEKAEGQERKDMGGMEEGKMYILRNESGLYGAAGILNGKLIRDAVKGHDCFILPSSIHETIFLLVSDNREQEELDGMVAEINRTCVDEEERLVDHSYYYDAKTGEIRICA